MGLSPVFDLAARALSTQQLVLQTAGHNLANVDRPSYSRQEVVLGATAAQPRGNLIVGSGVTAQTVRQIVAPLVESQLLGARSRSAEAGARRDELSRLERLFNDFQGGGLQEAIDGFFAGADDLVLHLSSARCGRSVRPEARCSSSRRSTAASTRTSGWWGARRQRVR